MANFNNLTSTYTYNAGIIFNSPSELQNNVRFTFADTTKKRIVFVTDSLVSIYSYQPYSSIPVKYKPNKFDKNLFKLNFNRTEVNIRGKADKVELFSMNGTLVKMGMNKSANLWSIPVSSLPHGLYIIRVIGNNKSFRYRYLH